MDFVPTGLISDYSLMFWSLSVAGGHWYRSSTNPSSFTRESAAEEVV